MMQILIVHDATEMRQVLRRVLELRRAIVYETGNATLARRLVDEWPPSTPTLNAALVDVGLPEGSEYGFELARWLLAILPGIDITLITGDAPEEFYERATRIGCRLYETGSHECVQAAIDAMFGPESRQ
jgi:CheY-like chemotaxis protein